MKAARLLKESRLFLNSRQNEIAGSSYEVFSEGAKWMHFQLSALEPAKAKPFPASANFALYGTMKYTVCLIAFLLSAMFLYRINFLLAPLAILVFYFFEVQLLFLFPLLIDKVPSPGRASIRAAYKIGIVKMVMTVIPIAFYMLAGLTRKKNPLKHWYVGCMAIIIWYAHEVRNRI